MSELVPAEDRLWALMHDAAEAYVGDLPKPIKRLLPSFQHLEDSLMDIIAHTCGMAVNMPGSVHEADGRMLLTEARDLMYDPTPFQDWYPTLSPYDFSITPWNAWESQARWFQLVRMELGDLTILPPRPRYTEQANAS
jgi:hypothetical protein